jgi:hypothetical protein
MADIFTPQREPARSIYLVLQAAIARASQRPHAEQLAAEVSAVFEECQQQALAMSVYAPTIAEVRGTRVLAGNRIDRASKWVYELTRLMIPNE